MYLNIWTGTEPTTFTYYEDDGETYQYEKGEYYKRSIVYDPLSHSVMLKAKEGTYKSKFTKLKLVLHDVGDNRKDKESYELRDEAMIIKY